MSGSLLKKSSKSPNGKQSSAAPVAAKGPIILPSQRLEWVEAWGMASKSMAHVYRPSTPEGVAKVFELARATGRTVAMKGGGNSYGDAFQNNEEIVLDLSRMTRVLAWNPDTGVIDLEPGVRLADLWRYIVEDGWWPPVVSGTMFTTIGGCCGMNIHGKNAWAVGTFGDHVQEFDLLLPTGEIRTVSRASDPVLFRGAISGFGMMGAFTRIRLKMKRIYSGQLHVIPRQVANFREMMDSFEENADSMDYMVGWADCFPSAPGSVGRGEMHFARQFEPGEDASPAQSMRVVNQELPDTLFGFFPKSIMWRFLRFFVNKPGMQLVNQAKFLAQFRPGASKSYAQAHAAFHFLLDYVPDWKLSYAPGGLIQYQSFVPRKHGVRVFTEQLRLCQRRGIVPFLGVTKKHKPDDFLISHGVDGYSLALDFPVAPSSRKALWRLTHELDEIALAAGGRFYFAKDHTMRAGTPARYLPEENLAAFHRLKNACDPEGLLSTNLYRRVFGLEGRNPAALGGRGQRNRTVARR